MVPRKRRNISRAKSLAPQTSLNTHVHSLNTSGFAALADELYLEIISYIPAVPIPTQPFDTSLDRETRRSRHETSISVTNVPFSS